MKAGVIGLVDGDFDVVDSVTDTVQEGDRELARVLEIRRVFSLPSGAMAFEGHAARERLRSGETTEIDGGEIRVRDGKRTETQHAAFAGVPGAFVVVGGGAGSFAFDLLARETDTTIERASIDVDGFVDADRDVDPWKVGFADHDGNAENGLVHGTDLLDDPALRDVFTGATLNQLGAEHPYGDRTVKMTATASGYVEVYRPSEFDTAAYLEYLRDEVVDHVEE